LLAALLVGTPLTAAAERLPFRHYGVGDGLVQSRVAVIHQDGKGYLWFGTLEGLSRFDGHQFVNYGTADGLDHPTINAIAEDQNGGLWFGTNGGGVAHLLDLPARGDDGRHRRLQSHRVGESRESNRVNALGFDAAGTLWCATDHGFYRAVRAAHGTPAFELVIPHRIAANSMAALMDRRGHLWFGYFDGLIEIVDGRVITHAPPPSVGDNVVGLVEDPNGVLLVAFGEGLYEFVAPRDRTGPGQWSRVGVRLLPGQQIGSLAYDRKGKLWIGTTKGLVRFAEPDQDTYTAAQGLALPDVLALTIDRDGSLWVGTPAGVSKLPDETIVTFTRSDGLPGDDVPLVIEARDGRIYASTQLGLVEIADGRVRLVTGSDRAPFDSADYLVAQDAREDWWIGTTAGLFRFPGPTVQFARGQRVRVAAGPALRASRYANDEGRVIFMLYADDAGGLWAGVGDKVYRWDGLRAWHPILDVDHGASGLLRDRSGALWVTTSKPEIRRWQNGRSSLLQPAAGLPEIQARSLFQDSRGWLWIGLRTMGVSVTRNPDSDQPTFVNYSTKDGLASDTVWAITEDEEGRMYLGTGRGLDQWDPATGRIRHITTADGLAGDVINHCLTDGRGDIWVATNGGVSRIDPRTLKSTTRAPNVYLVHVSAAGQELAIPPTGTRDLRPPALQSWQSNLRVEYVGVDFQNTPPRYQYKLDDIDREWSGANDQRALHYARLPPGSYRLLIRAVMPNGAASEPARLEFRILAPFWQRWWFMMLAVGLLVSVAFALHRLRLRQVLAIEGVRRQIATDLHDEVGAGLAQIAILSEVAQRKAARDAEPLLSESAMLARALRESMGDIVWAVDPRQDRLADLVQRMKQTAFNALQSNGLRVEFSASERAELMRATLSPDRKRQLLLIFKEAVTNIARHAHASHVQARLSVDARTLRLTIEDDGQGFTPSLSPSGRGLENMRRRAVAMKGHMEIASSRDSGTCIRVSVPLNK
jgi:ligand-binding sensor domain-containing protein/signal transduction histidine kinase